jgi:hypothetical protein
MMDWDAYFLCNLDGDPGELSWIEGQNGRWHNIPGATNATPTFFVQAGAYTSVCLGCDCPATSVLITGVKSSNE